MGVGRGRVSTISFQGFSAPVPRHLLNLAMSSSAVILSELIWRDGSDEGKAGAPSPPPSTHRRQLPGSGEVMPQVW